MRKYRVHELARFHYSEIGEYIDEYHTDRPLRNDELVDLLNNKEHTINEMAKTIRIYDDGYINLNKKYKKVVDENEQLKSTNMEMEDYLARLEEANINLQIKLQKIRDYAKRSARNDWKTIYD